MHSCRCNWCIGVGKICNTRKFPFVSKLLVSAGRGMPKQKTPTNPVSLPTRLLRSRTSAKMGHPKIAVPAASLRYRIHALGGGRSHLFKSRRYTKVHSGGLVERLTRGWSQSDGGMGVEEGGTEEAGLVCTPTGGTSNTCAVRRCGQGI